MDVLFPDRARDNFHRAGAVFTPSAYRDFVHAAATERKQECVPRKKPFCGKWLIVVARSIEHHFNDSLDVAIGGLECADVDAEPACNRRSDLLGVQLLPLDLAALEDVAGEGFEHGLLLEIEAEGFQVAR